MGLGLAELLIIGVVLIVLIGLVIGLVVVVVSLARRRDAPSARSARGVEPASPRREGQD